MADIILFDIDLTLITTSRAGRAAMEEAFRSAFGIEEATAGVSFDGRTDHAIFMEVIATHCLADGDLTRAYRNATEAYLAALGPSLRERSGQVLPGVRELLDRLREMHAPGLATGNLRLGAREKLGHFGLWECFAGGGFGDNSPVRADVVRQGIEEMASLTGVKADPSRTIVLGDTPLDVHAAHLAGAKALGVATGSHTVAALKESGAEWVLPDLTDTEVVLDILRS